MKELLAAVFGLCLLTTPAAHAFTFEGQDATSNDSGARYANPQNRFSNQKDGKTLYQNGNTTILSRRMEPRPAVCAGVPGVGAALL